MEIYINRNGEHLGPYSVEQVNEQLAAGELSLEDLAWHEGAADWQPLNQLFNVEVDVAPAEEPEVAREPEPEPVRDVPAEPAHHPEPEYHPEPEPEPRREFSAEPAHQPEPEYRPEPEPEPERAPAAARSAEPPWVPPRRDGMQTPSATAGQSARLPIPTRFFSPSQSSSPAAAPAPAPARSASLTPVISAEEAQIMARKHLSTGTPIDVTATKPIWGLVVSAGVLILGVAITFFAYKEAAGLPRATTYVGWGLMLFGGFGFLMAVVRYFSD